MSYHLIQGSGKNSATAHLIKPGPINPALTIFNQPQFFFKSEKGRVAGALLFYINGFKRIIMILFLKTSTLIIKWIEEQN